MSSEPRPLRVIFYSEDQVVYESAYTDSGSLWSATDKASYERDKANGYPARRVIILKDEQ